MSKRVFVHVGLCAAASLIIGCFAILFSTGSQAQGNLPSNNTIQTASASQTGTVLADGVDHAAR